MTYIDADVGELLVKLCRLSKTHDVDIRIRRSFVHPNMFELVLDRKDHHALGTIDITKTFIEAPEEAAKYVFGRALYDIECLDERRVVMKIYFEDGYLVLGRYAPDFNFVVDANSGLTNNEQYLEFLMQHTPDCAIYTNSLVALHSRYCWNNEKKVHELYIRHSPHGEWFRVDKLTDRELREAHNLLHMYRAGAFRFKEDSDG